MREDKSIVAVIIFFAMSAILVCHGLPEIVSIFRDIETAALGCLFGLLRNENGGKN
jgi:hypothetical protein